MSNNTKYIEMLDSNKNVSWYISKNGDCQGDCYKQKREKAYHNGQSRPENSGCGHELHDLD